LINAARGGMSMKKHYKRSGKKEIAGAGLDVLEQEPIQKTILF